MKHVSIALICLNFSLSACAIDLMQFQTQLLPDENPKELVKAFVQADGDGMQTDGRYWPLVQRFTDWTDAPGYDEALVVAGYKIGAAEIHDDSAKLPVIYYVLGRFYQTSDAHCKAKVCHRFEALSDPLLTYSYELKRDNGRWVITGSPSGPKISPRLAYQLISKNSNSCANGKCETDPATQALVKGSKRAASSFHGELFAPP